MWSFSPNIHVSINYAYIKLTALELYTQSLVELMSSELLDAYKSTKKHFIQLWYGLINNINLAKGS